jgi:hypothetical protein
MASTYTPIATNTISGSATSSITFSSIAGTYTDLVLVSNGSVSADADVNIRFNGDSTTAYSRTLVYGDGTTASSQRSTSLGQLPVIYFTTAQGTAISSIQNYSNSTTYKTVISRSNSSFTAAYAGLWRNTAAITSINVYIGAGNFVAGTTFTLYGIKAA